MSPRRTSEHEAENERKVHGFPEVDERGGGRGELGHTRIGMDVMGNVGPSHRTGNRLHGDDELFIGAVRGQTRRLGRAGRTERMQIAGEGERRSRAQTPEAEVTGKRRCPDDAERSGARPSRRRLEGHPDGRTLCGHELDGAWYCRERSLRPRDGARPSTVEMSSLPGRLFLQPRNAQTIDRYLIPRSDHDAGDGVIALHFGELLGRIALNIRKNGLVVLAVERGRGRQVRQTGAEDGGGTEGGDGDDGAEKCRSYRNRSTPPSPLQCVTNADDGTRGSAGSDQMSHDRRPAEFTCAALSGTHTRGAHRRPQAENEQPRPRSPERQAGGSGDRRQTRATAPPDGASPTGASGERTKATMTAPAAPASATTRFRAVPNTMRWRRGKPRATSFGYSSLSTMLWRPRPCPTTARPANPARAAKIHQPTACGWIDSATACADVSWFDTYVTWRGLRAAPNRGRSAVPWRSRMKYTEASNVRGFTDTCKSWRREQVVFGCLAGWEFKLGRFYADDVQGHGRPGRATWPLLLTAARCDEA